MKKCVNCGKEIFSKRRKELITCSKSCSMEWRSKPHLRTHIAIIDDVGNKVYLCNQAIFATPSKISDTPTCKNCQRIIMKENK